TNFYFDHLEMPNVSILMLVSAFSYFMQGGFFCVLRIFRQSEYVFPTLIVYNRVIWKRRHKSATSFYHCIQVHTWQKFLVFLIDMAMDLNRPIFTYFAANQKHGGQAVLVLVSQSKVNFLTNLQFGDIFFEHNKFSMQVFGVDDFEEHVCRINKFTNVGVHLCYVSIDR